MLSKSRFKSARVRCLASIGIAAALLISTDSAGAAKRVAPFTRSVDIRTEQCKQVGQRSWNCATISTKRGRWPVTIRFNDASETLRVGQNEVGVGYWLIEFGLEPPDSMEIEFHDNLPYSAIVRSYSPDAGLTYLVSRLDLGCMVLFYQGENALRDAYKAAGRAERMPCYD
jgi:hypothetical protein